MEDNKTEEIIKGIVGELISKMGFSGEINLEKNEARDGEVLVCNIKTEDSGFLIGQYGVNLQALQHLARLLVRQKNDEHINFILDINSYRQEKNDSVIRMAREIAEQAIRENRALALRPMSAYERRIVHLELSKNLQIKTESIGEGEDRKVMVKPAGLVE